MTQPTSGNSRPQSAGSGGSMFHKASNVNIHGGTFIASGSGETDKTKKIAEAMALLKLRAEMGAPYDAAAREEVPKCHEHTRVAIIEGVHNWAHSQEPGARPLMWIYGPAGSGKTTIMQTVAETFDNEGSLAVSFFYSRLSAARPRDKENFVITMAHQLSLCIPALQQPLADALSGSSILNKSLTKQLDSLIIGPLKMLDPASVGPRCMFMVDGLDECSGDAAQLDVLNLLELLLDQVPHRVRILVASRSLSHIQGFFARGRIGERTQTTPLDNDYQSDGDIERYFISKFGEIREEHPAHRGLPSAWPPQSDIDILVKRASGQFIYASVVMKFIADRGRHPNESLKTIISSKAVDNARPYEELDAVYAQVLSTIEPVNLDFIQTLMGCLLLNKDEFCFANVAQTQATTVVDSLFMIPPGTTDARIHRLNPLITTNDNGMSFSHASFPEYLLDSSRSKNFFLDMRSVHCGLACLWFKSYTSHFKSHSDEGVTPCGVAGYKHKLVEIQRLSKYTRIHPDDTLLPEMFSHCLKAEWTSELQQAIVAFDFQPAFRFLGPKTHYTNHNQQVHWQRAVFWLGFIIWIEQQHLLSLFNTEYLQGCIRSEFLAQQISPPDRRTIAAVLTWQDDPWGVWYGPWGETDWPGSLQQYSRLILGFNNFPRVFEGVDIHKALCIRLCQILVPDIAMDGLFFCDRSIYANMILQHIRDSRGFRWSHTKMLYKAPPSDELSVYLKQNFLQMQFKGGMSSSDKDIFMSICIYLFECGVPFISEHRHRPEFDASDHWFCAICLLFDPFKEECADIELSLDPSVKLDAVPADIAEEHVPQPLQINHARQFIPVIPLLWIQAWIFWLRDTVIHFFPVVA